MRSIEERFNCAFAPWGIALSPKDVSARRRGKIVGGGWTVWYFSGSDERGAYLDYYASYRTADDRHVRLREGGPAEPLPTIDTFRIASRDPEENARLDAEYLEHNGQVGRLLREKGFGVAGDEPASVRVSRHLRLGGDKEREL